jgi:flagellar basal-body rod protein FlgB
VFIRVHLWLEILCRIFSAASLVCPRRDLAARQKNAASRSLRAMTPQDLPYGHLHAWHWGVTLGPMAGELERYMDLLSARQKLVASNIANADTPGYQTQDIDFQSEFQNALGAPQAVAVAGLANKNDGNNVSIDRESRLLAENALRFQAASTLLHSQIQQLRSAIKEGQTS